MAYKDVKPPAGNKISIQNGKLLVPNDPILPFIRGDGTGPDIWAAAVRVFDAAIQKAYQGKRNAAWFEVFAGETAKNKFDNWLPDDTVEAFKEFLVGIKGPLTTPVGGGIRSLNVALRQMLDLYVCLRPVQWFTGVPSPVKHPEKVNMVIFRENTEDIYAGIEYAPGTAEAQTVLDFLAKEFPKGFDKIRFGTRAKAEEFWRAVGAPDFPSDVRVGIGIKPVSYSGCVRLIHSVCGQVSAQERHPGAQRQHHEVHRGRFPRLGIRNRQTIFRRG
jgi:isocitrate dehydrogenase